MALAAEAQLPLIHAHNDYQKSVPLTNAVKQRAFSIEADVYLYNNQLLVAHDKKELPAAPALEALYLQPIIQLFKLNHNHISQDTDYAPVLMIDIKEKGAAALQELIKITAAHPAVFDRSVNKKAIQIVISGDRGAISNWTSYPSYILFDGRPAEQYDSLVLQKIAFISDSYANYIHPVDSVDTKIRQLATKAHHIGKLLRLWATADDSTTWKYLLQLGVDIINTDKVKECREFFK